LLVYFELTVAILIKCGDAKLTEELNKYADKCSFFFKRLFGLNEVDFNIFIHDSRNSLDNSLGRKTELWEVGNTRNNTIHILSKEIFESQSSHKIEEFDSILKHEICHIFYFAKFNESQPIWLNEGMSTYYGTPKKGDGLKKNIEYLKTLSFDKMHSQEEFRGISSKLRYEIVFAVINKLVKDFGESKLHIFIKSLNPPLTKERVKSIFERTFLKKSSDFFSELLVDIEDFEKPLKSSIEPL